MLNCLMKPVYNLSPHHQGFERDISPWAVQSASMRGIVNGGLHTALSHALLSMPPTATQWALSMKAMLNIKFPSNSDTVYAPKWVWKNERLICLAGVPRRFASIA